MAARWYTYRKNKVIIIGKTYRKCFILVCVMSLFLFFVSLKLENEILPSVNAHDKEQGHAHSFTANDMVKRYEHRTHTQQLLLKSKQQQNSMHESVNKVKITTNLPLQYTTEPFKLILFKNDYFGSLCLDGSNPAMYVKKGEGDGIRKWILFLEGGYWCFSEDDCVAKVIRGSTLTSSRDLPGTLNPDKLQGILSPKRSDNPHFFNWNVAYLPYCDGGSFAGHKVEPIIGTDGHTIAFLRGRQILKDALEYLRQIQIVDASHLLVTGCGSSSLGALLNAAAIESTFPSVKLNFLLDGGFYIEPNEEFSIPNTVFKQIFAMNNFKEVNLVTNCLSTQNITNERTCLFTSTLLASARQQLFQLTPVYDPWQLVHLGYVHCSADGCLKELPQTPEVDKMQDFKNIVINKITKLSNKTNLHFYQHACLQECVSLSDKTWNIISVNDTTPSDAVHKWIMGTSKLNRYTDCTYPQCNKDCPVL